MVGCEVLNELGVEEKWVGAKIGWCIDEVCTRANGESHVVGKNESDGHDVSKNQKGSGLLNGEWKNLGEVG